MRYVIGAAAFFVPFLIILAIGASGTDAATVRTRLSRAELAELREFANSRETLLERYAPPPGTAASDGMPHLALERFARRGCDPDGQPWFRLGLEPADPACGLLRRAPAGVAPSLVEGVRPALVLPLTRSWAYWEMAATPPKSP